MQKIENSRVLITGGAGFIGSNLTEALLAQNNEVVCLDNFATGKRENIQPFLTNRNYFLVEGDIRSLEDCHRAVDGVDYVLHQAALGSVPRSVKDPITTNDVNISGFLNMLVAARDAKVKRMVYASSSSVYGSHPELPKVEHKIGDPLSPYAVTKYVNELYANVFANLYGLPIIGLRYFNVFGRRQDPNGEYAAVIPRFVKALIRKEAPIIYGDGTNSRDFTYIDNVLQINQLAAVCENANALGQAYNVAYGDRVSLNELALILAEYLGDFDKEIVNIRPQYSTPRQGDIPHSQASIAKAKELLGYNPQFSARQGLKECVKWYWENLKD